MATGMDYSLVQRIIDGLGKILDTKPGSPDEGTYVTEQQLADWIKGQTVVSAYYYNGVMYSDALHTTPIITGQAGALYIDQDNNVLYRWDGAAWDAMSDNQLRQDILDGTVVAKKAECDEDGNNIKATYATKTEVQAADATLQNQVDNLDHRVENLEQSKGDYIVSAYKDGSVTPSGKGKWCVVEGVEGVSRCENNVANPAKNNSSVVGAGEINGITVTYDSTTKKYHVQGTASADFDKIILLSDSFTSGHGFMLYATNIPTGNSGNVRIYYYGSAFSSTFWNGEVKTAQPSGVASLYLFIANGTSVNFDFQLITTDLSVYFGGSIPADADTFAHIQTNYPHLLLPSDYGTRIVDWTGNGVRAWARNLWDEQWERGSFDLTTGQPTTYANNFRSKNHIPVVGGQTYCLKTPYNSFVLFYDANDNFLGNSTVATISTPYSTFNAPTNASYALFTVGAGGADYANNICFNKSDSQNGTYTPYHAPTTLSFPSTTLKSAGSVRDTLELNVEVEGVAKKRETSRIGTELFENLSWNNASQAGTYWAVFNDYKKVADCQAMSSKYLYVGTVPSGTGDISNFDKVFALYRGLVDVLEIYLRDTSLSGISEISGTFNYEKKEESVTLSDPIIDNTLLTESGGRLSTVQTGTVVDGISDLGFITL